MSCCGHCQGAGDVFNEKAAKKDLRRYHKKGPDKSTGLLLNDIRSMGVRDCTLLDVGSGIGVMQLELFKYGVKRAVNVDASLSYQQVAREEANKSGLSEHTTYHWGDVVELDSLLSRADIVTLDRVICCYPDPKNLIRTTASKTTRIYGVVYPRDRMITRIAVRLGNLWFRLRGNEFRTYIFPSRFIDAIIQKQNLNFYNRHKTFLWYTAIYTRPDINIDKSETA